MSAVCVLSCKFYLIQLKMCELFTNLVFHEKSPEIIEIPGLFKFILSELSSLSRLFNKSGYVLIL